MHYILRLLCAYSTSSVPHSTLTLRHKYMYSAYSALYSTFTLCQTYSTFSALHFTLILRHKYSACSALLSTLIKRRKYSGSSEFYIHLLCAIYVYSTYSALHSTLILCHKYSASSVLHSTLTLLHTCFNFSALHPVPTPGLYKMQHLLHPLSPAPATLTTLPFRAMHDLRID